MPSLEEFVDTLEHSGLIEEAVWQRWHAQHAAAFTTGEEMAQALVQQGLITDWQSGMLREGRWRGFFLGKYKILRQLGAGSMGAVYLAEHMLMRHRVAIKVMAQRLQKSQRHVERFQREAQATASVNHPRIVRAFDVEMSGNTPYLVMEYVEGDDLQKIVQDGGVLPVHEAAEIIRQSAEGLEAAHRAGLVHRDIKPSNILLDKQGQIHILDLGLARLEADEEASMTLLHNSKALGTVDYLAPEQARDSHAVDARADIYSLGCTLYFLLAGTPLFNEGTIPQRILAHQTQPPPDVRKTRPEVPDDLIKILEKMLAKERARRFASAAEVAGALEAFLAGKPIAPFLSTAEEADLMRIDLEEAAAPPPPKSLVAAAVAATAAAPSLRSGSGGSDHFAAAPYGSGGDGQSALPELSPLNPPELFPMGPLPLSGSDALLGALGDRDLQPLSSPTGFDTLSGQMDTTQTLPLPSRQVLGATSDQAADTQDHGSLRQWLVDAVAYQAAEGEGIGGLKYKLWFLILFGTLTGLIVAGTGYLAIGTLTSAPAVQQAQP
ncbi:MAG TPA: serine/threonine-protein kinase [Pirellulaceae bacterium]|nr:serine/threonine-protein kinase [Pirellulaceae bacterium]